MSIDTDPARLAELARAARASGRIALDTEFMGEGRYRTLLCLIQLAVPVEATDGDPIVLLDPLDETLDASALADVLADPQIEVVVHAGRQDIALLRRVLETDVSNVFDTQVAAGFAGFGAQSSYDSLLADVLDLRVAKSASFTRWDARPLSQEQLSYAREDVVHLLELAGELERRLDLQGRVAWAREECEPLARSSDERDPDTIFGRLPRVGGLSAGARTIARALVEWRERTAERQNRPVQGVLSDATLVEVARRGPKTQAELERIRGLGGGNARRAEDLLGVVKRARERPADPSPPSKRPPATRPDDAPLVALGEALLRARAREAGLAYELLAARADLQAIVAAARGGEAEADVRTLRGWRRELVGAELLDLLDGNVSLSVSGTGAERRLLIGPAQRS